MPNKNMIGFCSWRSHSPFWLITSEGNPIGWLYYAPINPLVSKDCGSMRFMYSFYMDPTFWESWWLRVIRYVRWKIQFEAEFCSKSFPIYYSNTYLLIIGIQDNIQCGGTVVTKVAGSGGQSAVVVDQVWICSKKSKECVPHLTQHHPSPPRYNNKPIGV